MSFHFIAYANVKIIKVGYFEILPYAFKDSKGNIDGIAVNGIIKKLNLGSKYKIQFYEFPLARGFHELSNGNIDLLLLTTSRVFLNKSDYAHSVPICKIHEYIFVNKNSEIKEYTSSNIFKNKTIGVRVGVNLPDYFEQKKNNLILSESSGGKAIHTLLQKLLQNRIDILYLSNPKAGILEAKRMKVLNKIRYIQLGDHTYEVYVGFAKKLDPFVKNKVNEIITKNIDELKIMCVVNDS